MLFRGTAILLGPFAVQFFSSRLEMVTQPLAVWHVILPLAPGKGGLRFSGLDVIVLVPCWLKSLRRVLVSIGGLKRSTSRPSKLQDSNVPSSSNIFAIFDGITAVV